MKCIIEGKFVENGKIRKKDGSDMLVAYILSGHEVVQVNNYTFNEVNTKPFQPVSIEVDVRSTDYGLMVSSIKK